MSDQPPAQSFSLDLDQTLKLAALLESLQNLSHLEALLPQGDALNLVHRIGLRLTYLLIHFDLDKDLSSSIRTLHRHYQHQLAQALQRTDQLAQLYRRN